MLDALSMPLTLGYQFAAVLDAFVTYVRRGALNKNLHLLFSVAAEGAVRWLAAVRKFTRRQPARPTQVILRIDELSFELFPISVRHSRLRI